MIHETVRGAKYYATVPELPNASCYLMATMSSRIPLQLQFSRLSKTEKVFSVALLLQVCSFSWARSSVI